MTVEYLPAALADLEDVYIYLLREAGATVTARVAAKIAARCVDMAIFPRIGTHRPELGSFGFEIRAISEQGYLIFTTIHGDTVHIVRVIHGSRDYRDEDLFGFLDLPR